MRLRIDKLMLPSDLTSTPGPPHYYTTGFSLKLSLARSGKGAQNARTNLSYSKFFSELKDL